MVVTISKRTPWRGSKKAALNPKPSSDDSSDKLSVFNCPRLEFLAYLNKVGENSSLW
ncbi:MAG: hypothetical protein AAF443_01725 [Chlamydiota bacterium]